MQTDQQDDLDLYPVQLPSDVTLTTSQDQPVFGLGRTMVSGTYPKIEDGS